MQTMWNGQDDNRQNNGKLNGDVTPAESVTCQKSAKEAADAATDEPAANDHYDKILETLEQGSQKH